MVLVGNNEDFASVPTKAWIFPREKGKLGRIYFGFKDLPYLPMGGMNERGLFFDCFSTPPLEVKLSKNKEKYRGFLMTKIMEKCGTVRKALRIFSKYNLYSTIGIQTAKSTITNIHNKYIALDISI